MKIEHSVLGVRLETGELYEIRCNGTTSETDQPRYCVYLVETSPGVDAELCEGLYGTASADDAVSWLMNRDSPSCATGGPPAGA